MPVVATSLTLGRTSLGLGDLTIAPGGVYDFDNVATSGISWSRVTVTSPWTHGRRLRSATKDVKSITADLFVISALSDDPSTHDGRLVTLLAALDQFAWTFSVSSGSLVRQWACEPADYTPLSGENFLTNDTDRWTTVSVSIPAHPIPSSGAW